MAVKVGEFWRFRNYVSTSLYGIEENGIYVCDLSLHSVNGGVKIWKASLSNENKRNKILLLYSHAYRNNKCISNFMIVTVIFGRL